MTLLFCFNHFDPLTGDVPEHFTDTFEDVAKRARAFLKESDSEAIISSTETLGWLLHQGETVISVERFMDQSDDYLTRAKLLHHAKTKVDFHEYLPYPDAHWEIRFATLALALIGEAVNVYKWAPYENKDDLPGNIHAMYIDNIGSLLAEAMEAVCYAEGLVREKSSIDVELEKVKSPYKKGNQKKNEKTDKVEEILVEYYLNGRPWSKRKAVIKFIEDFPDLVAHLKEYNRLRTMYDRLLANDRVKNEEKNEDP